MIAGLRLFPTILAAFAFTDCVWDVSRSLPRHSNDSIAAYAVGGTWALSFDAWLTQLIDLMETTDRVCLNPTWMKTSGNPKE